MAGFCLMTCEISMSKLNFPRLPRIGS
jgi:hypothetical protein